MALNGKRAAPKPRVVVLGGGNGLSTLLPALCRHRRDFSQITVGVTVADNGGDTGLYRERGHPGWGDLRRCIAATSPFPGLGLRLVNLKVPRFGKVGNRMLSGVYERQKSVDPVRTVQTVSRWFRTYAEILPVTRECSDLNYCLASGMIAEGECSVPEASLDDPIVDAELVSRLFRRAPEATRELLDAILAADMIVIGPGSTWSSVVAALLPAGIKEAILATRASVAYVCNVSTERGETQGYDVADHIEVVRRYAGRLDICLANDYVVREDSDESRLGNIHNVATDRNEIAGVAILRGRYVDQEHPLRHDAERIARVLWATAITNVAHAAPTAARS